ncbi:MAG: hypothetical protein HOI95_17405 [Chromatiales bacterium]|nr:hypothetical protein [Chromatiales bacterium]
MGASNKVGESGRLMFARLRLSRDTVLRPGDFIKAEIAEPPLSDVAVIPATAATEDGRLLVVGNDNRLTEVAARVLRRDGGQLVVTDVPFGKHYVTQRQPQLGRGVKVAPSGVDAPQKPDTIELSAERRKVLIMAITRAKRIPEERRATLLEALKHPAVPRKLVERIERRIKAVMAARQG